MRYFLLLLLIGGWCRCSPGPGILNKPIESIRAAYAPDKRVALFAIEVQGRVIRGETNLPEAKIALLRSLDSLGIAYIDSIRLLPDAKLGGRHAGLVRLSVCNIRSQAKHSAELATQALMGTPLKVLKQQGDWFLVQTPDLYLGWLDKDGFQLMDSSGIQSWKRSEKILFKADFGFARSAPAKDAPVVSDLLAGNILQRKAGENDWLEIRFPDGRTGFIRQEETMPFDEWLEADPRQAEPYLRSAHQFLGRPYLWGGTSGKGVDCSGFTKTVFYLNGRILPRDASQQVFSGIEIATDTSWSNLLPGDFLFFGRKATPEQKERITHVAIYLGEGKIIHSAGIVKIESLHRKDPDFAEDRFNSFIRAKRMLTSSAPGVLRVQDSPFYD